MIDHSIDHVADICDKPRCRAPAILGYLRVSLCQRHWDIECFKNEVALDRMEALVSGILDDLPTETRKESEPWPPRDP